MAMRTATSLRQLLKSLCHNSWWKYAAFWKLKHGSRTILTLEDGYVDNMETGVTENTFRGGFINVKSGIISFSCDKDVPSSSSAGLPIEAAVANMSCHLYSLGEGIIGEVALTGRHRWILATEFNRKSLPECPEEWQLQFVAGIKTILLVPVVPHGVVQLGSLDEVMEHPAVAVEINDLFSSFYHMSRTGNSTAPKVECLNVLSPFDMCPLENLSTPSVLNVNSLSPIRPHHLPSIIPQLLQDDILPIQDVFDQVLGTEMSCTDESLWKAWYSDMWLDPTEEPPVLNKSTCSSKLAEDDFLNSFFLQDEITLTSLPDCINPRLNSKQSFCVKDPENGAYNHSQVKNMAYQEFVGEIIDESSHTTDSRFLTSLPTDSDLHEVLGLGVMDEHYGDVMIATSSEADDLKTITTLLDAAGPEVHGSSDMVDNEWFMKQRNGEHLLDAVVSNLYYAPNDDASKTSRCVRSSSNSSGKFPDSCLTRYKSEDDILGSEDLMSWAHNKSACLPENECLTSSPTNSSSKSICMSVNEDRNDATDSVCGHEGPKTLQVNKRRGRSGQVHRARPRDRQLIQDRLKELRDLIPNGSKCSIDALLDRTVKHMLFLRSLSSQAEKMRNCTYSKAIGGDQALAKTENGASWAREVGNESEAWPLIVEDLDQPGQILVEMLCKEYSIFLEIAQVIRRLELTILKGVLESRSDKLWAHFVIEASRGFHRMHILWPLMQLLQRNNTAIPTVQ